MKSKKKLLIVAAMLMVAGLTSVWLIPHGEFPGPSHPAPVAGFNDVPRGWALIRVRAGLHRIPELSENQVFSAVDELGSEVGGSCDCGLHRRTAVIGAAHTIRAKLPLNYLRCDEPARILREFATDSDWQTEFGQGEAAWARRFALWMSDKTGVEMRILTCPELDLLSRTGGLLRPGASLYVHQIGEVRPGLNALIRSPVPLFWRHTLPRLATERPFPASTYEAGSFLMSKDRVYWCHGGRCVFAWSFDVFFRNTGSLLAPVSNQPEVTSSSR